MRAETLNFGMFIAHSFIHSFIVLFYKNSGQSTSFLKLVTKQLMFSSIQKCRTVSVEKCRIVY